MFKAYYRNRFATLFGERLINSDGLGDSAVANAINKRRLVVPRALADYYAVAGRHRINREHNRLYAVAELEWQDDHLVFMEENQNIALWGIPRSEVSQTNPIVWQASNPKPLTWYSEDCRLSQFIMAMWRWQLTGVQEVAEPGAVLDHGDR